MKETIIKSYKAFDSSLSCQGFQYEVGKEYEMDGLIEFGKRGFHACENPLEIFTFYPMLGSRFAVVEQSGIIYRQKNSTKVCSSRIKIKAELTLDDIIEIGIEWLKSFTSRSYAETENYLSDNGEELLDISSSDVYAKIDSSGSNVKIDSSGHYSYISSRGYVSFVISRGDYSYIGSSGFGFGIMSSGDFSRICSSGNNAYIGSFGGSTCIGSIGAYSSIFSGGEYTKIESSGRNSNIGSCARFSKICSNGDYAQIGNCGDYSEITSSGYYVQIGCSGDKVSIKSSGINAKICSSGVEAIIDSTGFSSIIMCAAPKSKAKAARGSWITLAEWEYSDRLEVYVPVYVKTEFVDGKKIKADTYYILKNRKFCEVTKE